MQPIDLKSVLIYLYKSVDDQECDKLFEDFRNSKKLHFAYIIRKIKIFIILIQSKWNKSNFWTNFKRQIVCVRPR